MLRTTATIGLLAAGILRAGSLNYDVVLQPQLEGNTLTVDLLAFYSGSAPQFPMGSFSATLTYLPALLSAPGVSFDVFLGDASLGEVSNSAAPGAGSISLSAVSSLKQNVLGPTQPAVFPLATVTFSSTISDSAVDPALTLEETFGLSVASFQWSPCQVCPEPSAMLLLGGGLAALGAGGLRRRWRRPTADGNAIAPPG